MTGWRAASVLSRAKRGLLELQRQLEEFPQGSAERHWAARLVSVQCTGYVRLELFTLCGHFMVTRAFNPFRVPSDISIWQGVARELIDELKEMIEM